MGILLLILFACVFFAGWCAKDEQMKSKYGVVITIDKEKLWYENAAEADALFDASTPTFAPKDTSLRKEEEACKGGECNDRL